MNQGTRKRRTKAQVEQIDRQIVDVLAADNPQSVRHVFYRLTDTRLSEPVAKTEQGYKAVQRRCLKLRQSGRMPYHWISDSTRLAYRTFTYANAGDFIESMAHLYRANLWDSDLPHVEVWCESRSIAGVLTGLCSELAVDLYPAGGFTSATFAFEAAREIDRRERERAIVFYVGDFDPAGLLIDRDIERKLREHLRTPLNFRRVAINVDQITKYDLPTKPRKASERRRPDVAETVEAEAMPAETLRQMLRNEIEALLPSDALSIAQIVEEEERSGLRRLGMLADDDGGATAVADAFEDFMGPAP